VISLDENIIVTAWSEQPNIVSLI